MSQQRARLARLRAGGTELRGDTAERAGYDSCKFRSNGTHNFHFGDEAGGAS